MGAAFAVGSDRSKARRIRHPQLLLIPLLAITHVSVGEQFGLLNIVIRQSATTSSPTASRVVVFIGNIHHLLSFPTIVSIAMSAVIMSAGRFRAREILILTPALLTRVIGTQTVLPLIVMMISG